MRLATPEQMRAVENHAALHLKLSPEILMETAGLLAAREIMTTYMPELRQGRVAVICGGGNNGGDGLVCARHLYAQGFLVTEVFLLEKVKTSGLFNLQLERLKATGIKIHEELNLDTLKGYALYVDALFGIGLSRHLNEKYIKTIEALNSFNGPVVSLDIPSGLDALTGHPYGACVRASLTLTFGAAKPALYSQRGSEFAGKIRVLSLGLPQNVYRHYCQTHFVVNEAWAHRHLPVRKNEANKFSAGRLYVRAGKPGTWGAAALVCDGAYRMGAGYVTLLVPSESEAKKYLGDKLGPEVLVSEENTENLFEKKGALVVGPGAGVDHQLKQFIVKIIKRNLLNVVVDADGLTVLAELRKVSPQFKVPPSWILTPHAGELARLSGISAKEIEDDRFKAAKKAQELWGCHILLKGYRSLVVHEDKVAIIASGNAALAKAGTGDVLSGFVGALLAQGLEPFEAVTTAAYLHGRVADDWVRHHQDEKSLKASDLILNLPTTLQKLNP